VNTLGLWRDIIIIPAIISGGSRGAPPLFWVKKEEMTEERKAGWARKVNPPPA